jgi:predicted RecA/RadA family phage recombinase
VCQFSQECAGQRELWDVPVHHLEAAHHALEGGPLLGIVKAVVGVCAYNAAARAEVEVAMEGVFDLAKNAPDVFNPGDVAKVASGSNIVAAAGTLGIGWVVQAAAAGAATVRVKLTPSVASPPTLLAR